MGSEYEIKEKVKGDCQNVRRVQDRSIFDRMIQQLAEKAPSAKWRQEMLGYKTIEEYEKVFYDAREMERLNAHLKKMQKEFTSYLMQQLPFNLIIEAFKEMESIN